MSNYFRRLPNLDYPSLLNDRESNIDFVQTKNLFRRAKIREDLFANFMQFDKYETVGVCTKSILLSLSFKREG